MISSKTIATLILSQVPASVRFTGFLTVVKQNGFKALVYLHRYNADTIGNVRVDYLYRMQHVYESEIGRMQDMIDNSKDSREVSLATKRKEKITETA